MSHTIEDAVGVAACETAFGWLGIAWSEAGLVGVTLPQPSREEALSRLEPTTDPVPLPPAGLDPAGLAGKLQRYFRGEAIAFEEPLDPTLGTDFQRRVWAITRAIPRGQTRTYGQLARRAGSPGAARAVGQAMANNPWPIVVPCHRVVGHDGRLTGFGGGVEMKRRMLQLEGATLKLIADRSQT
jgi:methylated-DNA-[protein]-cysteine S-methyltransferase